jgi:hypothetical protein
MSAFLASLFQDFYVPIILGQKKRSTCFRATEEPLSPKQ